MITTIHYRKGLINNYAISTNIDSDTYFGSDDS